MNFEAEPILAAAVNILVGLFVSHGLIDSAHAPMIAQEINNILAAAVTLGLGVYSIYKTVEAYKHKVTTNAQTITSTTIDKSTTIPSTSFTTSTNSTPQQTGLPLPQ